MRHILVAVAIAFFACASQAATTVPHTFVAGAAAKAADVNDNFNALATAIDNLAGRVGKLESQGLAATDVAGTYTWTGLQTGLGNALVESIMFNGTLTLASNGTFSASLTEQRADLKTGGAPSTPSHDTPTDSSSGTWTVSGNTVTIVISGGPTIAFKGASGNRILVGSAINNSGSPTIDRHLIILTRN